MTSSSKGSPAEPGAASAAAPLQAAAPEGATLSKDLHTMEWNGEVSVNHFHLFVNETEEPVDLSWGDEFGNDISHSTIEPHKNAFVGSYAFHTWRVRSKSRGLISSYKGPSVTLTILPDGIKEEPNTNGHHPHQRARSRPARSAAAAAAATSGANGDSAGARAAGSAADSAGGGGAAAGTSPAAADHSPEPSSPGSEPGYRQRSSVLGMPIWAFDCVSDTAVARLAAVVGSMLIHAPRPLLERLVAGGGSFAIFGIDQVVSDVPAHRFMRYNTGRDLDTSARGLGATPSVPVTSCGEENLTMQGDRWYPCQSILVHEMAHMVHNMGLPAEGPDGANAVLEAYRAAKKARLYPATCYMMTNEQEYWAVAVESWFESTVREDVNGGIGTRAALRKHDPQLAKLLMAAFGDGEWRYWHDCPRPLAMPARGAAAALAAAAAATKAARGSAAKAKAAAAAAAAAASRPPAVVSPPQAATVKPASGLDRAVGPSWRSRRPTKLVMSALLDGEADTTEGVRLLLRRLLCRRFLAVRSRQRTREPTQPPALQPSEAAGVVQASAASESESSYSVASADEQDDMEVDAGASGAVAEAGNGTAPPGAELPVPMPGPCTAPTQKALTGRRRHLWGQQPPAAQPRSKRQPQAKQPAQAEAVTGTQAAQPQAERKAQNAEEEKGPGGAEAEGKEVQRRQEGQLQPDEAGQSVSAARRVPVPIPVPVPVPVPPGET